MISNYFGILLLTLTFFLSGIDKIINFKTVSKGLQTTFSKKLFNIPLNFAMFSIVLVILLEILAPIIINYSSLFKKHYQKAKYATNLLIIFVIMATYLYHFPAFGSQYYPFMSNLALIGGLIILSNHFDDFSDFF